MPPVSNPNEEEGKVQAMLDEAAFVPLPPTPMKASQPDDNDKPVQESLSEGGSLVLMVHKMLSGANDSVKQEYANGEFSPLANDSLRQIYDVEVATGRSPTLPATLPEKIDESRVSSEEIVGELEGSRGWLSSFPKPKLRSPPRLKSKTRYDTNVDEAVSDDAGYQCATDFDPKRTEEGTISDSSWYPSFSTPDRNEGRSNSSDTNRLSDPPGLHVDESPPGFRGFSNIIRSPKTPPDSSGKAQVLSKTESKARQEKNNEGSNREPIILEHGTGGWFSALLGGQNQTPATPETKSPNRSTDDEKTLPESPPDVARQLHTLDDESEEEKKQTEGDQSKKSVRFTWFHFALLALLLTGAIGGLAYGLTRIAENDTDAFALEVAVKETAAPTDSSSSPSLQSSDNPTTSEPTQMLSAFPTRAPGPTPRPTPSPTTYTAEMHFEQLMASVNARLLFKIQNPSTKHYQATQWLVNDPDYFLYDNWKIIQRWTLALFSLEVSVPTPSPTPSPTAEDSEPPTMSPSEATEEPTSSPSLSPAQPNSTMAPTMTPKKSETLARRFLNWNPLESWMTYTDECTWFTSWHRNTVGCDRSGVFKRLVLINTRLEGTLPTELTLLSNLDTLMLPQNEIRGTIPKEYGSWASLREFNMTFNRLEGIIPSELGNLPNLAILDLAVNDLYGPVPDRVCSLDLDFFRGDCEELSCKCCTRCEAGWVVDMTSP